MREGRHGKLQHDRPSFVYIPEAGEPASAVVVNVAGGVEYWCPPSVFVAQPPVSWLNKRPVRALRLYSHVTPLQKAKLDVSSVACHLPHFGRSVSSFAKSLTTEQHGSMGSLVGRCYINGRLRPLLRPETSLTPLSVERDSKCACRPLRSRDRPTL
jgi:hypothetical protein